MSLKLLINKHGNTVSNKIISFSLLIASLFTIMKADVIYDFSKNDNLDGWYVVDDGVMGGRSVCR